MTAAPQSIAVGKISRGLEKKTKTEADVTANKNHHAPITMLPVHHIYPCAENRKEFDPDKLEELKSSIQMHGLQQPIVVRRRDPGGKDDEIWKLQGRKYEIIMGERRWISCSELQMEDMPVRIIVATDEQATELRAIENLQREDLRAIDEARAYQQLMDLGFGGDRVAERVGKSRSVVYARLALLKLPAKVLQALDSNKLPGSHAELVTKLENVALQEEFTAEMLKPREHEKEEGSGVLGYREAKNRLQTYLKIEQNRKAFDRKAEEIRTSGIGKVLTEKEAEKVLQWGRPKDSSGYATLDSYVGDGGYTEWKKALGKTGIKGLAPVLAKNNDRYDEPIVLYRIEDLKAAAKAVGYKVKRSSSSSSMSEKDKEALRMAKLRKKAHNDIVQAISVAAENESTVDAFLLTIVGNIGSIFRGSPVKEVAKRRCPGTKIDYKTNTSELLTKDLKTRGQRRGLILEIILQDAGFTPSNYSNPELRVAKIAAMFGVDADKLRGAHGLVPLDLSDGEDDEEDEV